MEERAREPVTVVDEHHATFDRELAHERDDAFAGSTYGRARARTNVDRPMPIAGAAVHRSMHTKTRRDRAAQRHRESGLEIRRFRVATARDAELGGAPLLA